MEEREASEEAGLENESLDIIPAPIVRLGRPDATITGNVDALWGRGFVNDIDGAKEYLKNFVNVKN